jgi:N-acylneuraminate cytidylyltransferase
MKKIIAIIPVRKGSVRVRNKNIKPFAGSNLLRIKIRKLKEVQGISDIVVSSDCPEMLSLAEEEGVLTHRREDHYASSEVDNSEFFANLAESIGAEHVMYSPVTCPLISSHTYQECIEEYQKSGVNNLVTVSEVKHHMWLDGRPLNYDIRSSPNSQDLPDVYKLTYGVCLISREDMISYRNVVTDSPTFKVLDEIESIDIDTEFDFMVAETIYKNVYL